MGDQMADTLYCSISDCRRQMNGEMADTLWWADGWSDGRDSNCSISDSVWWADGRDFVVWRWVIRWHTLYCSISDSVWWADGRDFVVGRWMIRWHTLYCSISDCRGQMAETLWWGDG